MRLIVLEICGGIALLVFVVMLTTIARHRVLGRYQGHRPPALAEYLWATIPWLMILSCAIPAVRQVVASAREPFEAAPQAPAVGPTLQAFLLRTTVVIDQEERE